MQALQKHPKLALAAAAAGYVVYKINKFRKPHAHIPGPEPNGLKGNVDDINLNDLAGSILECHEKYGDCFCLWMGPAPWVITCNQEDIKFILVDKMMKFDRSVGHYKTAGWLGSRSIVNIPNKDWPKQRKVFQEAFQPEKLDKAIPIMVQKSEEMRNLILKDIDKEQDLCDLYLRLSTDVTGLWAFDYDPKALTGDEISEVHEAIVFAHFHWNKRIWSAIPDWAFQSGLYMGDEVKEFKRTNEIVYKTIYKIIDDRYSRPEKITAESTDLLSVLMFNDKDKSMSRQDLAENMYTMFTATMNAPCVLEWCLALCGKYPECEKKLRDELATIFGKDRLDITPEKLDKLQYMKCFINECMRVHMPARAPMMRTVTEDVVLPGSNTEVPAGTEVVFCPASIAFMEKYFGPDVNEFKPERWQKDADGKTIDMKAADGTGQYNLNHTSREYTFLPFEDGRRGCIGRHFAYREVMVLLTHFLQSFELLNVDASEEHENSVICRPLHLRVKLKSIA